MINRKIYLTDNDADSDSARRAARDGECTKRCVVLPYGQGRVVAWSSTGCACG
jgi:hypothetical protein